eukprot:Tbor_TRINITY_DN4163_c0_g1::TRINITY_DN4163_c0_g1_i1::g.26490::m.26490/K14007/SEC24; protein transport protein SEC24
MLPNAYNYQVVAPPLGPQQVQQYGHQQPVNTSQPPAFQQLPSNMPPPPPTQDILPSNQYPQNQLQAPTYQTPLQQPQMYQQVPVPSTAYRSSANIEHVGPPLPNQGYTQQYQQYANMPPQMNEQSYIPLKQQQQSVDQNILMSGVQHTGNTTRSEAYNVYTVNITRAATTGKVANNSTIPRVSADQRDALLLEKPPSCFFPNYVKPPSYETIRPTHNIVCNNPQVMSDSQFPFGCIVRPLNEENEIPLVNFSQIGDDVLVVRCRKCRGYINPFASFTDGGRRWLCPLCRTPNDVQRGYISNINQQTGLRDDLVNRPELTHCSCEFVAPAEYMVRPPQRPIFTFLFDVSYSAVQSGMLKAQCEGILSALEQLENDDSLYICIIAFDSVIYLFNLRPTLSSARMIVAADLVHDVVAVNENSVLDPVELPALPEDLIVSLKESMHIVRQLIEKLPDMFQKNNCVDSCFGPALTTAISLMSPSGGKIVASVATIPSLGEGMLVNRYNKNLFNTPKEHSLCTPASEWYKHRSLAASQAQISVDLAVNGDAHVELATLAPVSRYTSGHIYRYNKVACQGFSKQMERVLLRNIGFEAVLRVRTSNNVTAPNFFGHCYVRGPDLLALPTCDSDTSYAVQLQLSAPITTSNIYVQFALLYTTRTRERRIRVHTIQLPVTSTPVKMFNNMDGIAVAFFLSKMCIDFAIGSPFSIAQQKVTDKLLDGLKYFKKSVVSQGTRQYLNQLIMPEKLIVVPYLLCGFFRASSVRTISSVETPPDERVAAMSLFMVSPVEATIPWWCPYVHTVYHPKESVDSLPSIVLASIESLRNDSIFLIEMGSIIHIWVGKNVPKNVLMVYGIPDRVTVSNGPQSTTQENDCPFSDEELHILQGKFHDRIEKLQQKALTSQWAPVVYGNHCVSHQLSSMFVEDDASEALSYLNYLAMLYKKLQMLK